MRLRNKQLLNKQNNIRSKQVVRGIHLMSVELYKKPESYMLVLKRGLSMKLRRAAKKKLQTIHRLLFFKWLSLNKSVLKCIVICSFVNSHRVWSGLIIVRLTFCRNIIGFMLNGWQVSLSVSSWLQQGLSAVMMSFLWAQTMFFVESSASQQTSSVFSGRKIVICK